MEIQTIIKNRRIQLGLTMKDVAKALNVSEATISRYESSDIQNMGIDKLVPLAKILHCSPGYLMGWEEEKKLKRSRVSARDIAEAGDSVKLTTTDLAPIEKNGFKKWLENVKETFKKIVTGKGEK